MTSPIPATPRPIISASDAMQIAMVGSTLLAGQTHAQHVRILGANGHDQADGDEEALEDDVDVHVCLVAE